MLHLVIELTADQDEVLEILMEIRNTDKIAAYLSQWDYGDYGGPYGVDVAALNGYDVTQHSIPNSGEYTLVCNWGLGDAMLLIDLPVK